VHAGKPNVGKDKIDLGGGIQHSQRLREIRSFNHCQSGRPEVVSGAGAEQVVILNKQYRAHTLSMFDCGIVIPIDGHSRSLQAGRYYALLLRQAFRNRVPSGRRSSP
jgi:hypothetical protein